MPEHEQELETQGTIEQLAEEATTPEAESPEAPDFDAIGFELNAKFADIIKEYDQSLPVIHMVKILNGIVIDLMARQAAYQAHWLLNQYRQEQENKSRIIL